MMESPPSERPIQDGDYIISDGGYGRSTFLMKPVNRQRPITIQYVFYNVCVCGARLNASERPFGVLKQTFQILNVARNGYCRTMDIINACMVV